MSVTAKYRSRLDVTENLTGQALGDASVVHNGFSSDITIDALSTVPATKVAAFRHTLAAGAGNIDMTALVGTNGAAVDLTGLKIQMMKLKAPSTNTGVITIVPGASNGLDLLGAASSISIRPGAEALFYFDNEGPDIAAADAELDTSGTGTEYIDVIIVAG